MQSVQKCHITKNAKLLILHHYPVSVTFLPILQVEINLQTQTHLRFVISVADSKHILTFLSFQIVLHRKQKTTYTVETSFHASGNQFKNEYQHNKVTVIR